MARYHQSVCRLCRREGMKLFLKGDRCFKESCSFEKRSFPPGQHGRRRQKIQAYGQQLREKQKVKRIYGLLEQQFRKTFASAAKRRGVTGETLLRFLETRLDSVVFRLGFASSRPQARQLVRHGHVLVNGRRVNVPSFRVREGDAIHLGERARKNVFVQSAVASAQGRGVPPWLALDAEAFRGTVKSLPKRAEIPIPIQEQLIVELYSK
ncbi:MAG: 30S ribosomal protein S4 [Acidobacteria bacterium]|nr:30S ribosomal protein S4 [Acidobacteriota bacterium]